MMVCLRIPGKIGLKEDINLMINDLNNIKIKTIKIDNVIDERGKISFFDDSLFDFKFKRIYFLNSKNSFIKRGMHAHINLKQFFLMTSGSCRVTLKDGLGFDKSFILNENSNEGLLIYPGFWREIDQFSSDGVLLVIASDYHDKSDYINDYNSFVEFVNNKS